MSDTPEKDAAPGQAPDVHNLPYINPGATFWVVGDDETHVYSSSRKQRVPRTDADFVAWLKDGGMLLHAADQKDIDKFLEDHGL